MSKYLTKLVRYAHNIIVDIPRLGDEISNTIEYSWLV